EKGHGPVGGFENLEVFLVDREGHPDLEPAEVRGQDDGPGGGALNCHLGPRARAGAAVATPANMHSSAPSATITASRLIAFTSARRDRPARAGAAIRRSPIAGASAARPGGIRLESCWNPACSERWNRSRTGGGMVLRPWPGRLVGGDRGGVRWPLARRPVRQSPRGFTSWGR